jgi:hypothetical protein
VRELFVYYQVREDSIAAAREAVSRMQRELRVAHPGLVARLMTRRDGAASTQTWMETYALRNVQGDDLDASIENAIASQATSLTPFIDGPRHVEAFHSDDPG